jgi:hypothetical protein
MTRKHKLALVSAVVLGLAGAGAAFASGGGRDHGPASASVGRTSLTARWGGGAQGFLGARGFGLGFGFGRLGGGYLQTASDYLGVSVSTLMGDLRSGKSLADVAGATSGKSESGLVDALVAKAKSQLEKAMSAGKLSQDQVTKLEANLQQGVKTLVEAKWPKPQPGSGKRGFGRGFGFGFGFGFAPHGWGIRPSGGANP